MKITETTQMEFNPEIEVKMTLKDLSTIIATIGGMSEVDMNKTIQNFKSFGTETAEMIKDIGTEDNNFELWCSLVDQIKSAPKKPKFTPFSLEIESMEELLALRIGTARLTKSSVRDSLSILGRSDDLDSVFDSSNYLYKALEDQLTKSTK